MPLNERKINGMIIDECKVVDERCPGYRQELIETVNEIVSAERQHRIQGTNIQQKVSDKCNAMSRYLMECRVNLSRAEGGEQ